MTRLLSDKVAIVTGAGSGIGRAIAEAYARSGAKVLVSDLDETGGNETVARIHKEDGQARFVRSDVTDPEQCKALVDAAVDRYDGLHIACNNAGIGGALAPTGEYRTADWDKVIAVNLSGVFYGMRHQIPAIAASGGGAIVNVASILGSVGFRNAPAYVAAKHGVVGLTKTAALEHAPQRVRINAVGPAFIKTPLLEALEEEALQAIAGMHPIGRLGAPDEVAELVLWLSSDKASFVTGSYHLVDGGYTAQ